MIESHIEASSEIEAKTVKYPIQTIKYPQTRPGNPPLISPNILDESVISQVLIAVHENPRMEINLKFRCTIQHFL